MELILRARGNVGGTTKEESEGEVRCRKDEGTRDDCGGKVLRNCLRKEECRRRRKLSETGGVKVNGEEEKERRDECKGK